MSEGKVNKEVGTLPATSPHSIISKEQQGIKGSKLYLTNKWGSTLGTMMKGVKNRVASLMVNY